MGHCRITEYYRDFAIIFIKMLITSTKSNLRTFFSMFLLELDHCNCPIYLGFVFFYSTATEYDKGNIFNLNLF